MNFSVTTMVMPVASLAKICCNVIAAPSINPNAAGKRAVSKSQRIMLCNHLLQFTLPTELIVGVISQLPIDEILNLENELPLLAEIFEESWRRVCQRCAEKSLAFRVKLVHRMQIKRKAITYPQMYWSFANEFTLFGHSTWTYREIFLNSYLSELLYSYSQHHSVSVHFIVCEDGNATAIPTKRMKRDCQLILQSALGSCKHEIPNNMMIDILLNHVTKLTLNLPVVDSLKSLLQNIQRLENVTELVIDASTRRCNHTLIFDLTKSILTKSPIRTVHLEIQDDNEYFCMIKKLIALFSVTTNIITWSSLWDEALTNSPQQIHDCYDDVDIYEFHSTQPSTPQENTYQITALYISMAHSMRTYDKRDMFNDCFNYWYCLETLCISLNYDDKLTTNVCHGLTTLLASNKAKLRNVKFKNGCFELVTFCTLGLYLNGTEVEKSLVFEACQVMNISNEKLHEGFHFSPKSPEVSYPSISKVSLVGTFHGRWHDRECCSMVLVVSILLQCYNPHRLYIYSPDSEMTHDKIHNPIVRLSAGGIRLAKLIFDHPAYKSEYNDVLTLLSDTSYYNSKDIDVHIISSKFQPHKYEGIFKNMTVTRQMVEHDITVGDHSLEDFVAQM